MGANMGLSKFKQKADAEQNKSKGEIEKTIEEIERRVYERMTFAKEVSTVKKVPSPSKMKLTRARSMARELEIALKNGRLAHAKINKWVETGKA